VLFDEWYTCLSWNDIVKYLNDTPEKVEIKGKGFVPFLVKHIFMTSRKALQEAFNFGVGNIIDNTSVHRDWGQFERRLDFVIEFTGNWEAGTTQIHFHKGSEEDFRNMI